MNRDGRYAPSPTGVLHLGNLRTALLAWLFARSAGARFAMRVEDLDTGRVRPEYVQEQLDDLAAIGLDWDGEVLVQSERTALYEAALAKLPVYECFCTRAEIREAASAAHGPVDAYPGRAWSSPRPSGRPSAPPAATPRCASTPAPPGSTSTTGCSGRRPASSTTSSSAATTARSPTTSRSSSTTPPRASARSSAAPTSSTPPRARSGWLARSARHAPAFAHVPLVLGEDGRRLAKRHGDVTLREVDPADAVAWMAGLGLRAATRDLLRLRPAIPRADDVSRRFVEEWSGA